MHGVLVRAWQNCSACGRRSFPIPCRLQQAQHGPASLPLHAHPTRSLFALPLAPCPSPQVMLKDVADSKRINTRVHAASQPGGPPGGALSPGMASPDAGRAVEAAIAAHAAAQQQQQGPASGTRSAARQQRPRSAGMLVAAAAAAAAAAAVAATPSPNVQTRASARAAQLQQQQQQQGGNMPLVAEGVSTPRAGAAAADDAPCPEFDRLSAIVLSYLFWPKQDDRDKVGRTCRRAVP